MFTAHGLVVVFAEMAEGPRSAGVELVWLATEEIKTNRSMNIVLIDTNHKLINPDSIFQQNGLNVIELTNKKMNTNDIDRWYEYQQAQREAYEWAMYEAEKDLAVGSMTDDEREIFEQLERELFFAEDHQEDDYAKYKAALKAYNLGVAKWPILLREY